MLVYETWKVTVTKMAVTVISKVVIASGQIERGTKLAWDVPKDATCPFARICTAVNDAC